MSLSVQSKPGISQPIQSVSESEPTSKTPIQKFQNLTLKIISLFSKGPREMFGGNALGIALLSECWTEHQDEPLHRPRKILKYYHNIWLEKHAEEMSFNDFLEKMTAIQKAAKDTQQSVSNDLLTTSVIYFNPDQLTPYLINSITNNNGQISFYNNEGLLEDGKYIFVIGPDAQLYVALDNAEEKKFDKIHHTSFFQGKSVMLAGGLVIENGFLSILTNSSGHYKHPVKYLKVMSTFLEIHTKASANFKIVEKIHSL
jgi:hypothetical protein